MRTLKVTKSQLFDDIGRVFNGPKLIPISITKISFTVFDNMILQRLDRMLYALKNGSRAVARI